VDLSYLPPHPPKEGFVLIIYYFKLNKIPLG
jgi:hypothetical protein